MSRIIVNIIPICSKCAQTLETEGLVYQRPDTKSYEILVKPCLKCLIIKEKKLETLLKDTWNTEEIEKEVTSDILCMCGHERWRHVNDGECSVLYPPNVGTWCPCKEFRDSTEIIND